MQKSPTDDVVRSTDRLKAIGLMMLAVSFFACLDTTGKYLSTVAGIPFSQVVWVRFLGQFVAIMAMLGLLSVPRLMRTQKPKQQFVRSILLLSSTFFNFLALYSLRLDQALTIQFLAPLAVALLAGPVLGEWIGWRRLVAIVVGFCGILIAIRPGYAAVHPAVFFAMASMLSYVGFILITRYLAPYDPPENTLFLSLIAGSAIMAPVALIDWAWPSTTFVWLLLASLGFWAAAGHYLFIVAHRLAPAATVAPFLYSQLMAVAMLGYAVFGDLPDGWTLMGSAVIVASGLYMLHRERVRSKPRAVEDSTPT